MLAPYRPGFLGVCVPIASVSGTFLVQLFTGNRLAMFLAPCAIGGFFILLFAVRLSDRRLAEADKPTWSLREFASRFMFVLAYAVLTTYQVYYLLDKIGTAEADVPRQIFLGSLVQSVVVVAASPIGGLGFGVYVAVDLALVVDVLLDQDNAAKDLGVFNIAGALPFSVAPGIAPAILAFGGGSYGVLYAVAGVWAVIGALAILPVKGVW